MSAELFVTSVFLLDPELYKADVVIRDEAGEVSVGLRVKASNISEAEKNALERVREVAGKVVGGS